MIKIKPIKHNKIWGYEIWLHSPLKGKETQLDNGDLITTGPLVKIINPQDNLSVQIHPDDFFAKKIENEENGKTESWYILDAKANSEIILGMKNYDEGIIRKKLSNNTFIDLLNKVKPEINHFYNIPAGLVHGLGKGVVVLEVQQPSDTTYRYYDYNRSDFNGNKRQLDVDKAILVQKDINYNLSPISENPSIYQNEQYIQEFHKKPSVIKQKSIIVDLVNYDAYIAKALERVDFSHYAVIHLE